MRLSDFTASVFVACLLLPRAAAAQTIPSAFEFIEKKQEAGIYMGVMNAETGRFGLGPDGGVAYGARYAVQLSGPLALEGALGVVSGVRDVVNPARLEGDQVVGEADVALTTLDARLRFSFVGDRTWHSLAPFISAGGGIVWDRGDGDPVEETLEPADVFDFGTSFFGTLSFGTRWFLTDSWAVRLDSQFSLYSIDTPPGFSDPVRGFAAVDENEWMSGGTFTLGLLFRW